MSTWNSLKFNIWTASLRRFLSEVQSFILTWLRSVVWWLLLHIWACRFLCVVYVAVFISCLFFCCFSSALSPATIFLSVLIRGISRAVSSTSVRGVTPSLSVCGGRRTCVRRATRASMVSIPSLSPIPGIFRTIIQQISFHGHHLTSWRLLNSTQNKRFPQVTNRWELTREKGQQGRIWTQHS